ncbi:2-octaprenyl-6-methoxyphenyl hydroxylase [Aliidiomarina minuta]|uniref:2-octaprenyl-6-methoxyphenyl hydroxylase n=1 Tax=Aliidiomarina minuta TaxID=880057 RepID=A0A432W4M2_9GAMM|nr:2-octaprenyl-6-methoxyphenyl hydroxylase [Aliidiomarina minuta]RUO24438.1 2-octaprenyl-6-methoxyphenyl hydroxylase [Aliidiomarina minuta]
MKADIAIAGGGVVGALAALMLSKRLPQSRIAVVDAAPADGRDPRTLALAYKTQQLFDQEGLWQGQAAKHAAAIEHIHVSDRGGAGSSTLHAPRQQVQALGYVVGAHYIQQDLIAACQQQANISWLSETRVAQVQQHQNEVQLNLQGKETGDLSAKLLIAADGANSTTREQLGIKLQRTDYNQVALIANIELDKHHQQWAWERFTEAGPIALLPQPGREVALVWCVSAEDAEAITASDDSTFVRQVQQAFGYRAGRFLKVKDRASYPLSLLLAERTVHHRAVVLGNACHTLHPIAGQGYNLGVRDVESLVRVLTQSHSEDPGNYQQLLDYEEDRADDYRRIIGLTDGLVRVFSNTYPPLVAARNLALLALRGCPLFNYPLARLAMGYRDLSAIKGTMPEKRGS